MIQIQASWDFVGPAETIEKISKNFCTYRSFVRSLVRSKTFQILVRADAIDLVQKSSKIIKFRAILAIFRRFEDFEFETAPKRSI